MRTCKDCFKPITMGSILGRCKSCARKGTHLSEEAKRKVSESHRGEKHYAFKGRFKDKGYIWVYKPDHPHATKRGHVYEHRLVLEDKLKRYLLSTEKVDHINCIRDDNRPENLRVMESQKEHMKAEWGKGTFANRPKMPRNEFGRFI